METYRRTITRENIEDSLINGDLNPLHRDEGAVKEFLKIIKMENLGEGIIAPGALTLAIAEFLPPIKGYCPIGIKDINFISPLVVKSRSDIDYNIEKRVNDPPFVSYSVNMGENGREILNGEIILVAKDIYDFLTQEKIEEKVKLKPINLEKINMADSFEISSKIIEPYCKSIGIDKEEYYQKYGDKISGMLAGFFVPARLLNTVCNDGLFVYRKQSFELVQSYSGNSVELKGFKKVLKNIIYDIGLKIEGLGRTILESKTTAIKIA